MACWPVGLLAENVSEKLNTIAALAPFIVVRAIHFLGVLRAELEHVSHFDAAIDLQRSSTARTRIAGENGREIAVLRLGEIASRICSAEVRVALVAADDPVLASAQGGIGENALRFCSDRAAIAAASAAATA